MLVSQLDEEPLVPLSPATMADQVADRIVEGVASRRLSSGERLIETELASALHVSRVPIREAIRILTSQGIVVATPRRGARVATLDAVWARQLRATRVAVERLAGHLASEVVRRDSAALARVEACVAGIKRSRGNCLAMNRADIAFHSMIFAISSSPLLMTLWNAISRHVLIMFSIETYRHVDFNRVVKEHRDYIDVLLRGSPAEIDEEIDRHVAGRGTFEI